MLTGFRLFIETSIDSEVKDTIKKLPEAFRKLVKGYKFKFQSGCTLKGYKDSVGMIHLNNKQKKEIHVAAPWRFSREFTMLHELGHLIYEDRIKGELKKEWEKIVKNTKKKANQSAEELFCHAFAARYTGDKAPRIHDHPEWQKFIDKVANG